MPPSEIGGDAPAGSPRPEAADDGSGPPSPPARPNKSASGAAGAGSPSASAASFEERLSAKASGCPRPEPIVDGDGPVGAAAAASAHDDSLDKAGAAAGPSASPPRGPRDPPYRPGGGRMSHSDESDGGPAAPRPLASFKSDVAGAARGDLASPASSDGPAATRNGSRRAAHRPPSPVAGRDAGGLPTASPVPEDQVYHGFVVTDDPVYEAVMLLPDEYGDGYGYAGGGRGDGDGRPWWVRYNIPILLAMILVGTAANLGISLGLGYGTSDGPDRSDPAAVVEGAPTPSPAPAVSFGEPSWCLDDVLSSDSDGDGLLDLGEYTDMVSGWKLAGCPPPSRSDDGGGDVSFLIDMVDGFNALADGGAAIDLAGLRGSDGLDVLCETKAALLRGDGDACDGTEGAGGRPPGEPDGGEPDGASVAVRPGWEGGATAAPTSSSTPPGRFDGGWSAEAAYWGATPAPTPFSSTPPGKFGSGGSTEMFGPTGPEFLGPVEEEKAEPDPDGGGAMDADMADTADVATSTPGPTPGPAALVACYFDGIFDDVKVVDGDGDGSLDPDEFADLVWVWSPKPCDLGEDEVAVLAAGYNGGGPGEAWRPGDLCALREVLGGDGGPCGASASGSGPGLMGGPEFAPVPDFGEEEMMPESGEEGVTTAGRVDGTKDEGDPPGLRGPSFQPSAAPADPAESAPAAPSPVGSAPDPGTSFPPWATALVAALGAAALLGVPLACLVYGRGAAAGRPGPGRPGAGGGGGDDASWERNHARLLHLGAERVVASIPRPSREVPAGIHLVSRGKRLVVRSVDPAGPYGTHGLRAGMVVTSICGVPVAGRTPPEVVAIIRRAEGSVTVEAEAPGDLREWLEGQRRLHARSGLERERAKKLIEAGVLPRPDGGKEGRNSLGNGPDNV